MKKIKYFLLTIVLALFIPCAVFAEDKYFNAGDVVKDIGSISHSYFSAGATVNNEMAVKGLLFTAGNNITIAGNSDYAFIAGNDINITGVIENDLFVAGNNVTVEAKSKLGRDVYAVAANLTIEADIPGSAFLGGDSVTLSGKGITGDVSISASKISFAEGYIIEGTLKYNEDAKVEGLDKITAGNIVTYKNIEAEIEPTAVDVIRTTLFSILSLIVVAYVINFFFPKTFTLKEDRDTTATTLKRIGVGFLMLFCIPLISVIVMVTIVGTPLGIIGLVSYFVLLYLSHIFAGKLVGSLITNLFKSFKSNAYIDLAIGIVLIKLIGLIPTIGGIFKFIALLYGLGYVYYLLKEKRTAGK